MLAKGYNNMYIYMYMQGSSDDITGLTLTLTKLQAAIKRSNRVLAVTLHVLALAAVRHLGRWCAHGCVYDLGSSVLLLLLFIPAVAGIKRRHRLFGGILVASSGFRLSYHGPQRQP